MSLEPIKPLYFKKLDTLRFFAFFLVFWQHSFGLSFVNLSTDPDTNNFITYLTRFTGGWGVHIFFVISGFLITFLLIRERNEKGKVSIWNFYLRRILRIWPLYYFVLLLGIFVLPELFDQFIFSGKYLGNLTFLNNFYMDGSSENIGIAWSIAVEEQFYLFWPILFILFKNKKYAVLACFLIFGYSIYFNLSDSSPQPWFHTFYNLNYLMTGCLGAYFYTGFMNSSWFHRVINPVFFYLAALLVIALPASEGFYVISKYLSLFLLPICYLYLVIYLVHTEDEKPASRLSVLGKYTYGMYFYHPTILMLIKILFDSLKWGYAEPAQNAIFSFISLLITIGIAILSYSYFEKHFLKLKRKFGAVETRI